MKFFSIITLATIATTSMAQYHRSGYSANNYNRPAYRSNYGSNYGTRPHGPNYGYNNPNYGYGNGMAPYGRPNAYGSPGLLGPTTGSAYLNAGRAGFSASGPAGGVNVRLWNEADSEDIIDDHEEDSSSDMF